MSATSFKGKKLLVMAGGTGGHVFPGLACAKAWQEKGGEVCWMGTKKGIESRLVPDANIPIHYIHIEGVRGKGKLDIVFAPFKIMRAISEALKILKREKPDLVIGMGGFAAGPGGVAAKIKSIPLLIHEQNAVAGTTNKLLSKIASKVLQAFPSAFENGLTVGNPVRQSIVDLSKDYQPQSPLKVLVLGGSLGALAINKIMPEFFDSLKGKIELRHQTGPRHIENVIALYGENAESAELEVSAFISDMDEALEWADLIICRAGAMTVSEVAVAARPAIFIPYPYAIDDHQTGNALWLVDAGAALIKQEKDLTLKWLVDQVTSFVDNKESLKHMHENAQKVAIDNATQRVLDEAQELVTA